MKGGHRLPRSATRAEPKSPLRLDEPKIKVLEDGDSVVPFRFKHAKTARYARRWCIVHVEWLAGQRCRRRLRISPVSRATLKLFWARSRLGGSAGRTNVDSTQSSGYSSDCWCWPSPHPTTPSIRRIPRRTNPYLVSRRAFSLFSNSSKRSEYRQARVEVPAWEFASTSGEQKTFAFVLMRAATLASHILSVWQPETSRAEKCRLLRSYPATPSSISRRFARRVCLADIPFRALDTLFPAD